MIPSIITQLDKIPFFTLEGYMQIAGLKESEKSKARNRLSRAVWSGYILRVKKGIYITHNFYFQHRQDERFTMIISQIINPFSYISSLTVLQKANVLTEATYPVTAITQKQTSEVTNPTGTYTYQFIKPDLYTGFSSHVYLELIYHLASTGKALFDYLYLRPIPRSLRTKGVSLSDELRLNLSLLSQEDEQTFMEFVQLSQSEKMIEIGNNFKEHSWHL
jgi:hypothetical protein